MELKTCMLPIAVYGDPASVTIGRTGQRLALSTS